MPPPGYPCTLPIDAHGFALHKSAFRMLCPYATIGPSRAHHPVVVVVDIFLRVMPSHVPWEGLLGTMR